jgi:hypothetical protein
MKKYLLILFFSIITLFYSVSSYSSGVITHIGQAQDIINMAKAGDPAIPSNIASLITKSPETERAFRSGALDADIFNALIEKYKLDPNELNRGTHEKCSVLIASILLKNAKTDIEKAYAYGWALAHLPGDVIGHPLVNLYAGNGGQYGNNSPVKWDYDKSAFSGTNALHCDVERRFDGYVLNKFGFDEFQTPEGNVIKSPRLDLDIDIPVKFLKDAIGEAFGKSAEPSLFNLARAEMYIQIFLYARANGLIDNNYPEDSRFLENYNDAIEGIKRWMNDPSEINENYNLDDGTRHPNDCPQMKRPILRPSPGGDYPDDTFDVATLQAAGEVSFEDWLRVAVKNNKKWAIFDWQLRNKLNEFKSLPPGTDPFLREQKKKELIDFYKASINNTETIEAFRESNQTLIEDLITVEDVAILDNGYPQEMATLIAKLKEPTVKISPEILLDSIKDKKVIIIPSGGLYGLENSEFFKASLDQYVKQGGTLIVFAQQHGYEFSVLPVPQEADGSYNTIGGYGWSEDQSCFVNAAYIDTWHQMLAGQSKSTPTLHLDGYFTTYPSNANVLLRRTANGQPALLMYEYGQGQVIITSMYSDFALKQKQASSEEIALVRDMINWAKSPDELPEIRPGETVSVSVEVKNITTNDASSVKLLIYNPNRSTLLSEQIASVSIPAGQSVIIPATYTTTSISTLGIYHTDYTLLDAQGTIIQPQAETDSGRFVVSKPPQSPAKVSQLTFSIQSDSEDYVVGSTVNFTTIAFNNSDIDRTVTAKVFDWHTFPVKTETILVPARGSISFAYSKIARPDYNHYGHYYGRLWVSFYENNAYLGASSKIYWVHLPSVKATVQTDKSLYKNGESVTISTSLKNNIALNWQTTLKIAVFSSQPPLFPIVFEDSRTVTLPPYGTVSVVSTFALPPTLAMGTYAVQVFPGTWEYAYTRFEVAQSQISTTPTIPSVFNLSTNNIPFTITNTGKINVSSGILDLSFKDPDGGIIYSGSQSFALAVGESKMLDAPISIPSLKLGTYILTYSQSDETRTGNPINISIYNTVAISPSFDKPSYRVRETANLKLDLINTGKFILDDLSLVVSAPDANYTNTQNISLGVNSDPISLNFTIPIPETISAGLHNMDILLTLSGGASKNWNAGFVVPASFLSLIYQGPTTLSAGDTIEMILENSGGVDTDYEAHIYFADQVYWFFDSKTATGSIQIGTQSFLSYTLPDQLTNGDYTLGIEVIDKKTNKTTSKYTSLSIAGLYGELSVRTDKDIYFSNEETTTLSTIVNQGKPIVDGNLHLEVLCAESASSPPVEPVSFHIFTDEVERGVLHFPPYFDRQELSLPISPDQWGNASVRIQHEGAQLALIDYVALRDSNGNLYSPWFVGVPEWRDYTSEAQVEDGSPAEVTGEDFYASWENLLSGVSYQLVMTAWEASSCGIVWEMDTAINQGSGVTETLNISAGNIGQAGKFYLRGELTNSLGQSLGTSDYPFYIIDGDTVLLFNTDKRIYKPGETVTITGRVENRAPITAENLTLTLNSSQGGQSPQLLLKETINLLSGGTYPFTITTTAGEEGVVNLVGAVKQNNQTLVSITDQYEVALPNVSVYVTAPDVIRNESFTIEIEVWNDGNVEATVQFGVQSSEFGDSQTITLPARGTKLIQYQQQIHQTTAYTFTFTGDYEETITKTVTYGLGASIQIRDGSSALGVFPGGNVAIPVTIINTGQSTETLEVTYQLNPGAAQQSKTYSLPVGGSATDTLYFTLTEGDYQITATSQKPDASAQASLSVRKENQVQMGVSLGAQTDGLIPVNVNLTNLGFNEINGSVNLSVTTGSGQVVWSGEETLSQLSPQGSQLMTFSINPSAIELGNYNLQVQLLNDSNQLIAIQSLEFEVQSANFQITQLPPYQIFMAGQEATFVFRVRNIGDQEGSFDLRFKAYDLIDSTQREWLKAGEEKSVSFSFMLPEDLEEKDYFATYELKAQSSKVTGVSGGQIKYHLAGISLNVNATLDKPYYTEGEIAHLTINIQSPNPNPQNLFARVNYAGYEPQQTFTLNGSQVLIFDIPLPKITGEKLFYGIYHEGGRSIHLNSLYIHKAGDVITVTTDKQVYSPGELVSLSVSGNASGNMTLSAPGGYTETFAFSNQATRSFTLPSTMTAGTYFINATLEASNPGTITTTHPFDVAGIQVKVLECQNDKGKYAATDTIITTLTISSNTAMPAILKAWIVDPTGQYTSIGELSITLSSSESSLITYNSPLNTSISGIHRLVYGIYGPEDLLLCSGSEAFDIGDAVLLGLTTDKRDYPTNTEPVIVTASLFGSVNANLQLELDGTPIKSESISLNGFATFTTQLQNITPGPHTLKATLTAGGLKSTKETSFTYALAYMPKPQISASPAYLDFGSINLGSASTQNITLSSTGNVELVIGTIALSGTNQGEFSIQNDNCSGRTIAPLGRCTLDILFSPTSLGVKSASLSIPSNAIEMPSLYLPLDGTGATILNLSINPETSGRVIGTGIDCPGDCTESFSTLGAAIQLTAVPTEGYRFVNWIGDINVTENPVTVNMDANKNVTANFVISAFTIAATAGLGGTITPLGPVTVNYGGSQTFFITPSAGYHVADVKVDGVPVGAVLTYTFNNVTSDHTIEAVFAINQYTITATAGSNGTISPSGTITMNHGASQTFTIMPGAGYHVADVKVDGVSVGAVTTFTFDNVTSNHTIEASFDVDTTATWAKTYGGQGYDVALSARQTGDGGYIVAGESWSFSPLFSDAWVIKLDANGSIQWQKRYGGSLNDVIYSIEQTQDGGYIMAGETNAVLPFLGLFWVVKINANGEVQWRKTYSQGWAHFIQQTSEGGYVATGMNMGKPWIVKLDANGSIQWQKKYAGILGDLAQFVQQTTEGGYIVAGMMKGEVWVLKLNSVGETQWQKTYGNSCVDANFSIQQTQEGGYIMASVSLTFGAGYTDIWIVKLDPNGAIEWQKTYGGSGFDLAHAIQQTQDGGYVVAGWTGSFGAGDKDAWVLKLDANGEIEWQKTYGGSGFDLAHAIQQTQDGGYVVAGWTETFGAGDMDMWVLKLDSNGNMSGCQEGLIGTTSVVPYNTSATMSQCNETGQTTYVSPKSGSARVNGTTVTPGSVCDD